MHFISLQLSDSSTEKSKDVVREVDLLPILFSDPDTLNLFINKLVLNSDVIDSCKGLDQVSNSEPTSNDFRNVKIESLIYQPFSSYEFKPFEAKTDLPKFPLDSLPQDDCNFCFVFIDPSDSNRLSEESQELLYSTSYDPLVDSDGINFTWRENNTDKSLRSFRIGTCSVPLPGALHLFKKLENQPITQNKSIVEILNKFFETEQPSSNCSLGGTKDYNQTAENSYQKQYSESDFSKYLQKYLDVDDEETIVGILSVPPSLSIQELMLFLDPFVILPELSGIRLIISKNQTSSDPVTRVMAFLKFQTFNSALTFYNHLNCQPFDVFEEATCYGIFVENFIVGFDGFQSNNERCYELPICPTCLVRLDGAVSGLRGETFSDEVPLGWSWGTEGQRCQACRRANQFPEVPTQKDSDYPEPISCQVCQSQEDRWVCLICAHIGCGRYKKAHARVHAENSNHSLALELGTGRVWDYLGDRYVHRIMHNQDNGQLLELPANEDLIASSAESTSKKSEKSSRDVQEEVAMLTMQLESQHNYFQSQVTTVEKANIQLINQLKMQESSLREKKLEASQLRTQIAKYSLKITQLTSQLNVSKPLAKEEESVFMQLLSNLREVRSQKKDQLTLMDDLAAQLRDINFFLKAQNVISTDLKELQLGSLELNSSSTREDSK